VCVEEDYRTVPPSVEYECVGMCFGGWRSSEYDDDVVQTSEGGLLRKSAAMTSSNDQSTQHGSHTIKQSVFRPRRSGWIPVVSYTPCCPSTLSFFSGSVTAGTSLIVEWDYFDYAVV